MVTVKFIQHHIPFNNFNNVYYFLSLLLHTDTSRVFFNIIKMIFNTLSLVAIFAAGSASKTI
jgi:hypothetical protein